MRAVGFALFLRETKTRLGGRWWGVLWTVGEPLANAVVMLFVYGVLRAHVVAGVDTLMFLVTGLLPFQFFKSLVLRLMEGIDANQGLFAYRQVRPVDAVLARAAVEVMLALLMLVAAVAVLAWLGHEVIPQYPLELLGSSVLLVGMGVALGLLAAVSTAGLLARVRMVVRIGFFPVFLTSGAIFPLSAVPPAMREWLLLNPVAHLIEGLRAAFFGLQYHAVTGTSWTTPALWSLLAATAGLSVYRARAERLKCL